MQRNLDSGVRPEHSMTAIGQDKCMHSIYIDWIAFIGQKNEYRLN